MLVVDFSAFLTYALAALPSLTGVPAHEWFGLALLAPVFVHCAQHVDRVARALPRCVREARLRNCGRLALDAALLVALSTVFVSGLGMSGTVLQTFGLYAEGYYTWSPLHAAAAKALLALLLVHTGSLYNLLKRRGVAKAAAHDDGGFDDERRSA